MTPEQEFEAAVIFAWLAVACDDDYRDLCEGGAA